MSAVALMVFGCGSSNEGMNNSRVQRPEQSAASTTREFSFEMVGYACKDPENPVSSKQAAIIETLCSALIEARRCRGESTSNFTDRIGDRLIITHKGTPEDHELQVVLKLDDGSIKFDVNNGVLHSRVQDFEELQKVFDETDGEFALLSLESSDDLDGYEARVGCYLPNNTGMLLAGDTDAANESDNP